MPRHTKLTQLAIDALEDLKGVDIKIIDVRRLTPIADTMIVCTGTSNRHVKSLAGSVIEKSKHSGHQPSGVEGMEMGEWVLVNLGEVIVHVMQLQARAFYQLEKLWDLPPADDEIIIDKKPKRATDKKSAAAAKPKKKGAKPAGKSGAKSSTKKPARKPASKPTAKRAKPAGKPRSR